MKKIIGFCILGLALAGCQSTGNNYQQYSYNNAPSPDGSSVTISDTKNSSWDTSVSNDAFDGKTIISRVDSAGASLIVRYKKSDDVGTDNGIDIYYVNGDSYICSSINDYVHMDVLIDGVKSREMGSVSTSNTAIFLYNGNSFWGAKDWITPLAKGKSITIRTHDKCGRQITNTFDITGWPKEFYELQNPKVQSHAENVASGKDEFVYLTRGKHKEWCAYAESKNFKGGHMAFNSFWNSKEMRSDFLKNFTVEERVKIGMAYLAMGERESGGSVNPLTHDKVFWSYSERMCKIV